MRSVLFLIGVVLICTLIFFPGEIYDWACGSYDQCQYNSGYSAGQAEIEEAKQKVFGGIGLYAQRDFFFIPIHVHEDKSEKWNEGHRQGILDSQ